MTREDAKAKALDQYRAPGYSWRRGHGAGFDDGWAAREAERAAEDEREIKRLIEEELL